MLDTRRRAKNASVLRKTMNGPTTIMMRKLSRNKTMEILVVGDLLHHEWESTT